MLNDAFIKIETQKLPHGPVNIIQGLKKVVAVLLAIANFDINVVKHTLTPLAVDERGSENLSDILVIHLHAGLQ